VSFLAILGVS